MGLPKTDGVKLKDFPPIKNDWYDVVFDDFEEKTKDGNPYTKIVLKIGETERLAWGNLSHSDAALWKVKEFRVAIAMGDSETSLGPYKGTRLRAFLQDREYQGSHYPEARKYKPLDDSLAQATPQDDKDLPF